MKKSAQGLNRRKFLKLAAAGTCGAACHGAVGPLGNIAFAGPNGPPGAIKNFVEIFMYGGCCSQGLSPVFHAGAQARYPTLYRTPEQAADLPGTTQIGLHLGLQGMIDQANITKSSVALVIGTGHPTRYSRSHPEAQHANEFLAYDSNLTNGIGVGAQIAQQIGDNFGLISFGGGSEFSSGGIIPARSVSSLDIDRNGFGQDNAYKLIQGMVRASSTLTTPAQQYVQSSMDSIEVLLPRLRPIRDLVPPGNFPGTGIGNNLEDVARLIMGQTGSVFFIPYGGDPSFDTHQLQAGAHDTLFNQLGAALTQFIYSLQHIPGRVAATAWDETVILFRTDFGRTWENNGRGTDHGHAYNQLVIGGKVRGGIHGAVPSVSAYQNASQDYMGSLFVQFNAMQPTKEIAQAMGLDTGAWGPYPGNYYSPIGIIQA